MKDFSMKDLTALRTEFVRLALRDFDNPKLKGLHTILNSHCGIDAVFVANKQYFIRNDGINRYFMISTPKKRHWLLIVYKINDELHRKEIVNHDEYVDWLRWYMALKSDD